MLRSPRHRVISERRHLAVASCAGLPDLLYEETLHVRARWYYLSQLGSLLEHFNLFETSLNNAEPGFNVAIKAKLLLAEGEARVYQHEELFLLLLVLGDKRL